MPGPQQYPAKGSVIDLKLVVNPPGKDVNRPAISVVGGIADKLIVEADVRRVGNSVTVIGLKDLLQPRMRQLAVAYHDAHAAGVEIGLVSLWKCR